MRKILVPIQKRFDLFRWGGGFHGDPVTYIEMVPHLHAFRLTLPTAKNFNEVVLNLREIPICNETLSEELLVPPTILTTNFTIIRGEISGEFRIYYKGTYFFSLPDAQILSHFALANIERVCLEALPVGYTITGLRAAFEFYKEKTCATSQSKSS